MLFPLVNDAVILLRSIAGDAATKTAGRVNPSDDKLRQIDDPAEDNTWHDVPDPKKMREQFKQGYNERKPFGKKDVKQAADSGAATTEDQADAPADTAATNGVKTAAGDLKSTASANVPEETKEKGRNYAGRTKSYLSTKMPKERREQTIWRLKKMVVEVQGHQDCKFRLNFGNNRLAIFGITEKLTWGPCRREKTILTLQS